MVRVPDKELAYVWIAEVPAMIPYRRYHHELRDLQVVDDDSHVIDIRLDSASIAYVNAHLEKDLRWYFPHKSKPLVRYWSEPVPDTGKQHWPSCRGSAALKNLLTAPLAELDDESEYLVTDGMLHRLEPHKRFNADAYWANQECWHSSRSWKSNCKSGKQWAKHKRGCSGKHLRHAKMLNSADTEWEVPFDDGVYAD